MSGSKHTAAPWFLEETGAFPGWTDISADGWGSLSLVATSNEGSEEEGKANARRIVACVNALEGLPTEQIEAGAVQELVNALEAILENCNLELKERIFYADGGRKINVNSFRQNASAALAKWGQS